MNTDVFDAVVIGSGAAGMAAAQEIAARGGSVALIERAHYLGGECPNFACIPTKTLLKSAELYTLIQHADQFGLGAQAVKADFRSIRAHLETIVRQTGGRHLTADKLHAQGITLVKGTARFIDAHTLDVENHRLSARQFVIATGVRPRVPLIPGLEKINYLTSHSILKLNKFPNSLIILGGGPVGIEYAQMMNAFGVDITLIQREGRILPREDAEAAQLITHQFERVGVTIVTNCLIENVASEQEIISLRGRVNGQIQEYSAEQFMLASGQEPSIDALGLEKIGVHTTDEAIVTDEHLRTTVPNIWAAGDVTGRMQYTHTAHYEGMIAGQNVAEKEKRRLDLTVVPRVVFTHLELASVGLTEAELEAKHRPHLVARADINSLGRALTDGTGEGFVKLLVDPQEGKILGSTIVSPRAGELIHEVALAMKVQADVRQIADLIHAFPTYSEAISSAAHRAVQTLKSRT
ncbi:NAD(P)/FAD-dependent oxidoreductase [Candidatus Berkelbacteria bacterium]|nr:NAD(P)/FAD-dependent oxidoreductase [Candidatus Berkelbacteria bacterium]